MKRSAIERQLIEQFFKDYGIKARIVPERSYVAGTNFIVWAVQLLPKGKIAHIEAVLEELAESISNSRMQATPVRLRKLPLGLELPHPNPQPLIPSPEIMQQPQFQMVLGQSFGYGGETDLILDLREQAHLLVAGATGSGKSSLVNLMLTTLLWGTPPSELGLVLIDMKNDDLVPFRNMPHVLASAYNKEQALSVVTRLFDEKERRIAAGTHMDWPQILVVIDEWAELSGDKEIMAMLASLLAVGRSIGIHILGSTQKPLASVIGSISKGNFTVRLVGSVLSSEDARTAAGIPKTGAEYLPGLGSFLVIVKGQVERFQAYYSGPLGETAQAAIQMRWSGYGQILALPDPQDQTWEPAFSYENTASNQLPMFVVKEDDPNIRYVMGRSDD